jgi:hypothetical protein
MQEGRHRIHAFIFPVYEEEGFEVQGDLSRIYKILSSFMNQSKN